VEELAARIRDALEAADLDAYAELLHPAVQWGAPGDTSPPCRTRDDVLAWYRRGRAEGQRARVGEIFAAGDKIVVGLKVSAGGGAEVDRWQVLAVVDGKIADIRGYERREDAVAAAGVGAPAPYIPLPRGLGDPRVTAAAVFDRIAALYDRARPGYPDQAVADLVRRCRVDRSSRVLEIGCGTGQLTRDLAGTGASIVALELGAELARLAGANLAAFPDVEIVNVAFEAYEGEAATYDLVVSATAFHWIDPAVGYPKAASLLRAGGWLGLVTNTHASGGSHNSEPFAPAVRELHRSLAPEVGDWSFAAAADIERTALAGGDIAAVWTRVDRKLGAVPDVSELFDPPVVTAYPWTATYTRDAYVDMLASQSSYALMEPERREELLAGVGRLVDDLLGGSVTKEYVTVLAAARRRTGGA